MLYARVCAGEASPLGFHPAGQRVPTRVNGEATSQMQLNSGGRVKKESITEIKAVSHARQRYRTTGNTGGPTFTRSHTANHTHDSL